MPSSPDNAAVLTNPQPGIGYLYQQHHRNRSRGVDNVQTRGRNISRYEFGRRDRYGERVTRIFPREIAKSPTSTARYQASPNPATSPLITAFGTTTSTAAHYTSEWTKSLPFFAGQPPPNGRSVSGSPGQNFGVSNSPPTIGGRPMSHPNHYPSFGGRLQASPHQSPPRDRRSSMFSQYSQQPPLPHQPQSHFYGLPDVDFGLDPPQGELVPGANGYFCGFDTLDTAGDKPSSRVGQNALLVGYEGGLDVLDVRAHHMNVLGRVEGLRGAVIGAKIVQWSGGPDPCADDRPLVALVIHGPLLDGVKDRHSSGSSSGACTDENAGSSSPPTRPASALGDTNLSDVTHYQTTVEIWSLKKGTHVATLYKAPAVPVTTPLDSPMFQPPAPVGDLRIDAKGKFVVVASGCSGEVFVFAPKQDDVHPETFRCIGKVWTTVQVREHTPTPSSASSTELNSLEGENITSFGNPLFSLSERWIAVVPPGSSSLYSLNGATLLSPSYPRPPGMSTHAPPPPPSANCQVDAPEDSFLKNASREVAQQAMKGMQWAASTGMQAWKSYWSNKPAGEQPPNGALAMDNQGQAYFPPTHGHNQSSPQAINEPALVSIFDLQRMSDVDSTRTRSAPQPLTTFTAPMGCSFLSLSPSGLMLMTFSKKGDNQFVWDLNCMNHTSSRGSRGNRSSHAHVRQVAKFTRMTVANIVDVAWSAPSARRLAILTDKGTVHMYPMPASAFQWPPPRRARKANEQTKSKDVPEEPPAKGSGIIGSAAQNITGKAKPFFNSVRNRGGSVGSGFSLSGLTMTPAAGAKGGKAVAAGLGKSIGGAASNLKHAGDNKLHLPALINGVNPSSVSWLVNPKHRDPRIALVSGGVLSIHKVNFREVRSKNGRPQTRITKQKLVEYSLNPIRDTPIAPATLAYLTSKPGEEPAPLPGTGKSGDSYWTPKAPAVGRDKTKGMMAHPLATAEIETNTPYQPFHTDRRIDLFVIDVAQQGHDEYGPEEHDLTAAQEMHHVEDNGAWAFGADIPSAKVTLPSSHAYDDDPLSDDLLGLDINGNGPGPGGAAGMVSDFALREGDEEVEQVVVTTRRRRIKRKDMDEGAEAEEGFFEDDCEVWDFAGDRV